MKKIYPVVFLTLLFSIHTMAQSCSPGSALCTPSSTAQVGMPHPDSLPCAIKDQDYDETIHIKMYSSFTFGPVTADVDSIQFDKIDSLPCGLCWSTNKANNRFSANEDVCIRIHGHPDDAVGQYKLYLTLKAWVPNLTPVGPGLVEQAGIKMYIRQIAQGGSCNPVDTSSSFTGNLSTSYFDCMASVNDLSNEISTLTLNPNPLTDNATLSFTCVRSEKYTLRITDITGKVKSEKIIQAVGGTNTELIHRNNLSSGIYFLSLVNERGSITKKFTVIE